MPSIAIFAVAGLLAPQQPAHAEAWDCKITAASNPAITMQEGRFEVMGNQLFGPSSDAVPLGWRMLIVKNNSAELLARNEAGADREWLMIDKRRGEIITYSFGYRAAHQGRCTRLV